MKAGVAWPRAGNKAFKGTLSSSLLSLTKWPLPPNVRLTEPKVESASADHSQDTRRRDGACATNRGGETGENIYNKKFFTNSNGHRWHVLILNGIESMA